MICMGMSDDGSGLQLVLAYDTPQQPIEINPIGSVEIEADTPVSEIEMSLKKVNIVTGEETELEVEVCK